VSTTVATIGIRGTEYTIAYANGVAGSVGEGQIDVCNGGGCLPVTSGQSFFVAGNDIRPEISSKKTDLPPNQPGDVHGGKFSTANDPSKINGQSTLPSFVSGDQTTQTGDPSLLLVLTGSQMLSVVTGGTPGFSAADRRLSGCERRGHDNRSDAQFFAEQSQCAHLPERPGPVRQ
jgi:hypothetical protein